MNRALNTVTCAQPLAPLVTRVPWTGDSPAPLAAVCPKELGTMLWIGSESLKDEAERKNARYRYLGISHGDQLHPATASSGIRRSQPTAPHGPHSADDHDDPFSALSAILTAESRLTRKQLEEQHGSELPPFIGGVAGVLSYDAARHFERVRGMHAHPDQPEFHFQLIDAVAAIDTARRELVFICWPLQGEETSAHERRSETLLERLLQAEEMPSPAESSVARRGEPETLFSEAEFCRIVERAKEYISAGDIFQVVLSNRTVLPLAAKPLELFERLRRRNPSPFHFMMPYGDQHLVGASPELFLRSEMTPAGQDVFMRLVAGTYPRGGSAEEEEQAIQRLRADEKENAEHVMLVDHCRNDIGRIAKIGTVRVSDLCSVEPYRDVFHLVSQVSGTLRPEESLLAAVRSCFPIATLTGTPKIRAMEIIAELEGTSRGCFGGSVLVLGWDGFLDSAVIIRSVLLSEQQAEIRTGAGIVADSVPEREYQECLWKSRAMRAALGDREDDFEGGR